jgi:segregation and condensation protein B
MPAPPDFAPDEILAWAERGPEPLPRHPLAPPDLVPVDPAAFEHGLRLAEALVFASDRPVTLARLQQVLPEGLSAQAVLTALIARTAGRPAQCVEVAGGFAFRTAPELAPALTRVVEVPRRLPRVAMETLAIIAYHQPVTRAEVEEIRGASLAQTTLEALLELGLVAPRGLKAITDLPRREELVNEPGPLFKAANEAA